MSDIRTRLQLDYNPQGMKQFIVDTREGETGAEALARAMKDVTVASEETSRATDRGGAAFGSMNSQARGLRIGMAGLLADMALMTLASGEQLPLGLREGAKGLQTVLDLAIAGNFILPGYGAVIGGVAGAVLALGTAALAGDENVGAMNKVLDALAAKDQTAETLAKIMGWTEQDAAAALLAAKNNNELAKALDAVAKEREAPTWIQQLLERAGFGLTHPIETLLTGGYAAQDFQAGEAMGNKFGAARDAARIAEELQKAQATQNYKDLQAEAEKYYSEIGTLGEQRVANEATTNARLLEYAKQLTQAKLNEENQIAQNNAQEQLAEVRAAGALGETLYRISRDYQEKETNLLYDHEKKLAQIAYDEAHQHQQAAETQLQQYQQLQDSLHAIDLSEARSLQQLDFNTHESLMSAKTNRDREDILRRALEQRGVIQQGANDQRSAAEKRYQEEQDAAKRKELLDQQVYQHQIDLENQNYQHQRELDKQAATQRAADAESSYRKQTDDLHTNLKIQNDAIIARYNQEVANINTARSAFVTAEGLKQQALLATMAILQREANMINGFQNPANYGVPAPLPISPQAPLAPSGGNSIILPSIGRSGGGQSNGSPQIVSINANTLLAPILADVFAQMTRSQIFREGVKIVMNAELNS